MDSRRKTPVILLAAAGKVEGNSDLSRMSICRGTAMAKPALCLASLLFCSTVVFGQAREFQPDPSAGPGQVIVHSRFGGEIYGFDIDQNASEGLLTESRLLSSGNYLSTVETFSQKTGDILKLVAETQTQDDFVTMGVVGTSVGVVEHEHVQGIYVVSRTFNTLNPLSGNKFTGLWTPPIGKQHIIMPGGVSRSQGQPNVAVFAYDNSGSFIPWVFSSNIAANTFGPVVKITDSLNFGSVPPPIGYDSSTNQAVLGGGDGCFGCLLVIGLVDLRTRLASLLASGTVSSTGWPRSHKMAFFVRPPKTTPAWNSTISPPSQGSPWYCRARTSSQSSVARTSSMILCRPAAMGVGELLVTVWY